MEDGADHSIGLIASSTSYQYVKEVCGDKYPVLKLGMIHPLPVEKIRAFAKSVEKVIVVEELDGIIEAHCRSIGVTNVTGKELFGCIGEFSQNYIAEKLGMPVHSGKKLDEAVPARPPVMCAGCPHRGLFYTLKKNKLTVLGDIGCYSLDMVLNAIGYPRPLTVTGYTSAYFGRSERYQSPDAFHTAAQNAARFDVDDFAAAFIRLEGDVVLDFRISWAMHLDTPGDTLILGTEGALRIPSTECWNGTVGGPMKLYTDVAGLQTVTELPIIPDEGPGLFDRKIRSFLDAIESGGPAPVPSSQILYNQAIIDAIARSAEAGREVEVVIPEV